MPNLSIAIVTSCRNYGRYLSEWADSILAQTLRPPMVAIVENGSSDNSAELVEAAAAKLRAGGLRVETRFLAGTDFGSARNLAVSLSDTEWVMHLDADDMLMPHALEDVAKLAPEADVVALGYERTGDLAAGPRQRVKLYRSSAGPAALANPTPASGVSPFRRAFWQRAPYPTDMQGGWDTALWRGFAHLGARFVPTTRPCFWYRQHADSIFNTRRLSGWPAAIVGQQLAGHQRGDRGVSILVPRAGDAGGPRDAAWAWLQKRYRALFPDWELLEGLAPRGVWCKGAAVEAALEQAHGAVLVIADADCVVAPAALREAVRRVEAGASWVVPHRLVHRLSQWQTSNYLTSPPGGAFLRPPTHDLARPPYEGFAGGGIVVLPRAGYVATGGIPRAFLGWGAEDEALALILDAFLGPHQRLEHDLVHLWHPPQPTRRTSKSRGNRDLFHYLRAAAGNLETLWGLVQQANGGHITGGSQAARAARYRALAARNQQQLAKSTASPAKGARPMAGAQDVSRAQRKAAQQRRNAAAVAAYDAAKAMAATRAAARGLDPHRRKQGQGSPENKMLEAPAGAEDKQSGSKSGVTINTVDRRPKPAPHPLRDVPFASAAARKLATEAGLTAAAFPAKPPRHGFTVEDVRDLGPVGGGSEIPFATIRARDESKAAGLTLMEYTGRDPGPGGFTLDYVRAAIARKGATEREGAGAVTTGSSSRPPESLPE